MNILPIDYFGVSGTSIMTKLLMQNSNKRARKVAFNDIERMFKATGAMKKADKLVFVGTSVDQAGQIWLSFLTVTNEEELKQEIISNE